MISYLRFATFVACSFVFQITNSFASDFDQDGIADFVLITVNQQNQLEWSAIDVNDVAKRSLGQLGELGDHVAVGRWTADGKSSKAIIHRGANNQYEWNLDLSKG